MGNVNCLRCRFRHEDNGNCTAVGGFCTAVAAAHCPLLREYLDTGLEPEEINDLASVREISPETEYAINKHADNIIERLDKLLRQTDDDARLRELAEADRAGRLVVLPVRPVLTQSIGSMLYIIEDGEIVEDSLCEALVGMGSNGEINIFYTTLSDQISFEQADIGKTVFLTSEEAEKALEAKRDVCP